MVLRGPAVTTLGIAHLNPGLSTGLSKTVHRTSAFIAPTLIASVRKRPSTSQKLYNRAENPNNIGVTHRVRE
jgi:hypothetical protein